TLARLPVTGNGKLDRRALPEPVWQTQGYVAPRNDTETLLAQVWQEVLGVEKVGITDNFFELGGHSLLLTRLVSRLRADLGVTLTLREAMELPTVEQLALWVAMRKPSEQKAATAQQLQTFDDLMADLEAS
ncbi:hypothetical protein K6V92_25845, partial [Cupriavidus respiraculi]|uniref:phosphopantetheine-binding protein n=1 Tax=Cupriavidus respiraculi TaxID=195930 RepID=UPI001C96D932